MKIRKESISLVTVMEVFHNSLDQSSLPLIFVTAHAVLCVWLKVDTSLAFSLYLLLDHIL